MGLRRHGIRINGHDTSISIEDEFWAEIKRATIDDKKSIAQLVTEIDQARMAATPSDDPPLNLSSAIRLYVLARLKSA
jgi:predicted DNA-binding ribbon-helix-helix protein